jgi:hypothetical protein
MSRVTIDADTFAQFQRTKQESDRLVAKTRHAQAIIQHGQQRLAEAQEQAAFVQRAHEREILHLRREHSIPDGVEIQVKRDEASGETWAEWSEQRAKGRDETP